MDDDLLFDYMFLEAQDKEEENERLREENEDLREKYKTEDKYFPGEDDIDKARFFAEDFQSIARSCGIDMEITYDEAERAINMGYTPEDYYEYKMGL